MKNFNVFIKNNIVKDLLEIKTAPLSEKDINRTTTEILKDKEVYGALKALSTK
ncbi:hypothetical protein [Pediococcus pentosaceus]|uniref:hypothetical protein n=1 Tax=Pediococcus pentosaceus TaxID=1255 RepID=UPI0021A7B892|nr:hypothetical protein [Pediococcus pentosaceus]